jgi:hypothetical protein
MLDLIFVVVFQAAPLQQPTEAEPRPPIAWDQAESDAADPLEGPPTQRWRCTIRPLTGTRLIKTVTCRRVRSASIQDQDTQQLLRRLQAGQSY